MDNIEELLRALSEDDEDDGGGNSGKGDRNDGEDSGDRSEKSDGLFSGLDPEMLIKMLSLFETLNQPNDNERFLLALKPLLREENRAKIDSAIRLMKLFSLLPVLKDSGLLGKLM